MARLAEKYDTQIRDELKGKFGLKNIFEVPKLDKIVVNIGVGEATVDSKKINSAIEDATGVRFTSLPMSPPKVLKGLEEAANGS